MTKYIILTTGLIIFGSIAFYIYNKSFAKISNLALSGEKSIKLPDLYDLITVYVLFCVISFSVLTLFTTNNDIKNMVSKCVVEDVWVSGVSGDYDFCINQFDNTIFREQDSALEKIMNNNKETIKKIEEERLTISTNRIDNLYFSLQNRREDEKENELYILLAIYLNYYETEIETYNRIKGN